MRYFFSAPFVAFSVSLAVGAVVLASPYADAACNIPPKVPPRHDGERGSIDSPFLIPGPHSGKHARKRTIRHASIAKDDIVTIAYLGGPDSGATATVRVLASKCSNVNLSACADVAHCDQMAPVIAPGLSAEFTVTEFNFKTDEQSAPVSRTGPVRIAVTTTAVSPCDVLTKACPTGTDRPGVHACIEKIKVSTPPTDDEIDSVTALPPSNDFSKICTSGGRCNGSGSELALAVDSRGDLLIPMDWSKVLKKKNDASKDCEQDDNAPDPVNGPDCDHRDVSALTTLPKAPSSAAPIQIPVGQRRAYLQTFNEYGETFPSGPAFDADTAETRALALYGDIDKPHSVLRVRSCKASDLDCDVSNPVVTVGNRVADGGAVVIPRATNGKGYCGGDTNGSTCDLPGPCASNVPCVGVNGKDKGAHLTSAADAATEEIPPPPPPASDPDALAAEPIVFAEPEAVAAPPPPKRTLADSPLPYWVAVLAILGVAWILVRRRGI